MSPAVDSLCRACGAREPVFPSNGPEPLLAEAAARLADLARAPCGACGARGRFVLSARRAEDPEAGYAELREALAAERAEGVGRIHFIAAGAHDPGEIAGGVATAANASGFEIFDIGPSAMKEKGVKGLAGLRRTALAYPSDVISRPAAGPCVAILRPDATRPPHAVMHARRFLDEARAESACVIADGPADRLHSVFAASEAHLFWIVGDDGALRRGPGRSHRRGDPGVDRGEAAAAGRGEPQTAA